MRSRPSHLLKLLPLPMAPQHGTTSTPSAPRNRCGDIRTWSTAHPFRWPLPPPAVPPVTVGSLDATSLEPHALPPHGCRPTDKVGELMQAVTSLERCY